MMFGGVLSLTRVQPVNVPTGVTVDGKGPWTLVPEGIPESVPVTFLLALDPSMIFRIEGDKLIAKPKRAGVHRPHIVVHTPGSYTGFELEVRI